MNALAKTGDTRLLRRASRSPRGRWVAAIAAVAGVAGLWLSIHLWRQPTEPIVAGLPLSAWLEGQAPISVANVTLMQSDRAAVCRWLLHYLNSRPSREELRYNAFRLDLARQAQMAKFTPTGVPHPKGEFLLPWLPKTRVDRLAWGHLQGYELLIQLAPGTAFENQGLELVTYLNSRSRSTSDHWGPSRSSQLEWLGNFTNHADRVIPILLPGLTNSGLMETCIVALQKFGPAAIPYLRPLAQEEHSMIRPATAALERIDPNWSEHAAQVPRLP